ncbi:MAG: cytochrome c oxidase subunit II [Paracoccaceae bacterium]
MLTVLAIVLILVASVVFTLVSPWWFTPIASNWGGIDEALIITFWICGVVFVLLTVFMAYAVWRYRHRPGQGARYEPENKRLEWTLAGATTVGIVAMLAPGLIAWADFIRPPADAIKIEVVGQQWYWSYRLPGPDGQFGAVSTRAVYETPFGLSARDPKAQDDILIEFGDLHLPVDRPVHLLLRSVDVLHDFYVPQFRAKMDLVPGMVTYFWLTPTRTGRFEILCAELCGTNHSEMRGAVIVEDEADWQAWRDAQPSFAEMMEAARANGAVTLAERSDVGDHQQ